MAFREFLLLPVFLFLGWLAVTAVSVLLDRAGFSWFVPVRSWLASVVPGQASATALQAIAPGLITVNSIIFFVLVMAVQHQSSTYSPVVLDQFLRRRMNQVFFGSLLGQTASCILVLAMVNAGAAVLSGALVMVATVATLGLLVVFIYGTVDQMRPTATVWMIRRLALHARRSQESLLVRCRDEAELADVPTGNAVANCSGYVIEISVEPLERAVQQCQGPVEIELTATLGEHLVPGAKFAEVRGDHAEDRERLHEAVCAGVVVARMPNVGTDAGHSVRHLGNMAWAAAATSDPEGARSSVDALYNLLAKWGARDERRAPGRERLPIVYRDDVVEKAIDVLTSVIVAAGTSEQHQTCAHALEGLSYVLPLLSQKNQQHTVDRLQRVMPTARRQIFTMEMDRAFTSLWHALDEASLTGYRDRVAEIKTDLNNQHALTEP